jgi:2'-hydroxyisoflavone reductase
MKILFLGGTKFLGRHLVEDALARDWDVSTFTRGLTNPDLFPNAEHLTGDRLGDTSTLDGKYFDAVIDTSGYHPRAIGEVKTDFYCFVSSISAYADLSKLGVSEDSPLAELNGPMPDEFDPEQYGALKVVCEREVARLYKQNLIVRPGLIVGPHDPTDRFTYWPARAARGGTILAPGRPQRQVQLIDVRDLAAWMLDMTERTETGTFNAIDSLTMESMLLACIAAAGTGPVIEWRGDQWLLDQEVEPWSEFPLWLPEDSEYAGMLAADASRAIAKGLTFRPAVETARDTLEWDRIRPPGAREAGMDPAREAELLRN